MIDLVVDPRGFVDDEERDAGVTTNGGIDGGDTDNAGAVGELQRDIVVPVATGLDVEFVEELTGLFDESGGLAAGGGDD